MRRKVYTRDQILKAAYDVVVKEGFKGFTARNIAKKMGISTQPIYLEFKNMDDLKNTLLEKIYDDLKENVFPVEHTGDKIIDLGINYIYFANNNHRLYTALYVDEHGNGKKIHEVSNEFFNELIESEEKYRKLDQKQVEALHAGLWIASTGVASLMSAGILNPSQDEIVKIIKQTIDAILQVENITIIE